MEQYELSKKLIKRIIKYLKLSAEQKNTEYAEVEATELLLKLGEEIGEKYGE